jgi:homoserine kinase type II
MVVFLLQHVIEDEDYESIKTCGVYSSESLAEAAIKKLSICPGFRDYSDGFHITEYQINTIEWSEGFVDMSTDEKGSTKWDV